MSGLASLYPPPPPFYKRYTAENYAKLEEYKAEHGSVPPQDELIAELLPPPPPPAGQVSYRNFGSIWNVEEQLPSLSVSGITQLYPEGSEKSTTQLISELRKLLHSALLAYLGLVQTLVADPTKFGPAVERLQTLFINMHHLLNTYRPLQSQESLVLKMEDQIALTKKSAQEMRNSNDIIRKKLEELERRLPERKVKPDLSNANNDTWKGFDLDVDLQSSRGENAVE